jgi:hypothetical protein
LASGRWRLAVTASSTTSMKKLRVSWLSNESARYGPRKTGDLGQLTATEAQFSSRAQRHADSGAEPIGASRVGRWRHFIETNAPIQEPTECSRWAILQPLSRAHTELHPGPLIALERLLPDGPLAKCRSMIASGHANVLAQLISLLGPRHRLKRSQRRSALRLGLIATRSLSQKPGRLAGFLCGPQILRARTNRFHSCRLEWPR